MSKDGLCAIVTGSASGLGAATAQILATPGARLVINYSNSKAEAEATAELCRKQGAEVLVITSRFRFTREDGLETSLSAQP